MGFLSGLLGFERTSSRLASGHDWVIGIVGKSRYQVALQALHRESGGEDVV